MQISRTNYSEIVLFAFYRPSGELVIIIEIMESELKKKGVFILMGRLDQTMWDCLAGMFTNVSSVNCLH